MLNPVANSEVEDCLRSILLAQHFVLSPKRVPGQNGVDICARGNGNCFHIETIGYKSAGSARARDFYEAFFRVLSRLNDGATCCVLALSHLAEVGLPARAKQHKAMWIRTAQAFPELEIWLVNTQNGNYRRTTWGEWANGD